MLWVLQHAPSLVFVLCFGASVGSFMNVVIYRIPAGMSVSSPPSRCPTCGHRLSFFRENLPIIGWFLVRGKCRMCGVRVSPSYMIVELLIALIFVAMYALLYLPKGNSGWLADVGGAWWRVNQFYLTFPAFFALMFMLMSLIIMTVIDARTYTIPIQIPLFVTGAAFVWWMMQSVMGSRTPLAQPWPIPLVPWTWTLASVGGMIGVAIGVAGLWLGKIPYSFADYDDYVEEGETLGDYPHARREMAKEVLFLAPVMIGVVGGYALGSLFEGDPPKFVAAIGASFLGYLVGGGVVWAIRIVGSMAFGREAMGMGDVHLLAAVGAVLGWVAPLLIFFAAPFSGLLWVVFARGFGRVFRVSGRELPFGPHLAIATVAVWLAMPLLRVVFAAYFGFQLPV